MRRLVLAEIGSAGLIAALLLTSPAAFAYYRFGALAHVVIVGLVFWLARRKAARLLIAFGVGGSLIALALLPPHFGAFDLLLILWTLTALPLISAGLVGGGSVGGRRIWGIGAGAVLALALIVSAWSIRAFPNWSATDEAIIFNYADTLARTGQIGATLIPYDAPILTGSLYIDAAAGWAAVFPRDPFALRALSAVGGALLIGAVGLAGWALDGAITGAAAAALLATNLLWLAASHIGRGDVWLAAFVWAAVGLLIAAQTRRDPRLALLAGVVAAVSADVHPLGAFACAAFAAWWLVTYRRANRQALAVFVTGGLIGAAYYLTVHVLPDPARFLAALRDEAVSGGAEGWTPLAAMLARHAGYAAANPLELGLLAAGSLAALRWRPARGLAAFVIALVLLYALAAADPNPYYPIVWIPGMVILTALALRRLAGRWRAPLIGAFVVAFALNLVWVARHVESDWNARAFAALEQVAAHMPATGHVLGESFLYLALRMSPAEGATPAEGTTPAMRLMGATFLDYPALDAGVTRWTIVEQWQPDGIVTLRDEAVFAPPFAVMSVDLPHLRVQIPDAALASRYRQTETVSTALGVFEIWLKKESRCTLFYSARPGADTACSKS